MLQTARPRPVGQVNSGRQYRGRDGGQRDRPRQKQRPSGSARLSDALYFWTTDQPTCRISPRWKSSAEKFRSRSRQSRSNQRMAKLDHLGVTSTPKLGTQGERINRLQNGRGLGAGGRRGPRACAPFSPAGQADLTTEVRQANSPTAGRHGPHLCGPRRGGERRPRRRGTLQAARPVRPGAHRSGLDRRRARPTSSNTMVASGNIDEKPTGSKGDLCAGNGQRWA